MNIEKLARKPSADPAQEQLRSHKDNWNEQVSEFISLLINLKRGLNGKQVPELNIPKNSIKEPLPDQIPALLDQLAGMYSKITQDGKTIEQEQKYYSEHRRLPQPKKEQQITPVPSQSGGGLELPSNLALIVNDLIVKEASNVLTRLWTYVKTPFIFSDKDRWVRKNLLQSAAHIDEILIDIESAAGSKADGSIPEALYHTKDLGLIFINELVKPLQQFAEQKAEQQKIIKQKENLPPPEVIPSEDANPHQNIDLFGQFETIRIDVEDKYKKILKYQSELSLITDKTQYNIIKNIISVLSSDIPNILNLIRSGKSAEEVSELYNNILANFNILEDTFAKYKQAIIYNNTALEKLAASELTRWLNAKWLEIWKTRDSAVRLAVVRHIRALRKDLNKFMNELQTKNAQINILIEKLAGMADVVGELFFDMGKLGESHNTAARIKQYKAKKSGKKIFEQIINEHDINILKRFGEQLRNSLKSLEKLKNG